MTDPLHDPSVEIDSAWSVVVLVVVVVVVAVAVLVVVLLVLVLVVVAVAVPRAAVLVLLDQKRLHLVDCDHMVEIHWCPD